MNRYSEVQIDDFKGSVEDISFEIAHKILPNDKINHLLILILLEHNSFVLLQLKRLLSAELDEN
jgi:hypothetical protein